MANKDTFLKKMNLVNQWDDKFCYRHLISKLTKSIMEDQKNLKLKKVSEPFVLMSAIPQDLENIIDVNKKEFLKFIENNRKGFYPAQDMPLIPTEKSMDKNSYTATAWCEGESKEDWLWYYTKVYNNGYIESGYSNELFWHNYELTPPQLVIHYSRLIGFFMMFLGFIKRVYDYAHYDQEIEVQLSLIDIKGVMLHGFGMKNHSQRWEEPFSRKKKDLPIAKEKNAKIVKTVQVSDLNENKIRSLGYDIAKEVASIFGEYEVKCFDENKNFYTDSLKNCFRYK